MKKEETNVLALLLLLIVLTLEISFIRSTWLNCAIVVGVLAHLICLKKWWGIFWTLLLPLLPALANYWAIQLHGDNSQAIILFTRSFALAALGMTFLYGVNLNQLLRYWHQKGLPSHFTYGLLVVLNAIPVIQKEIQAVREASLLRGKTLHFWSPIFYIKAIFIAFNWRDSYVEAMYAHGFDETVKRSYYRHLETPKSTTLACFLIFLLINLTLFIPK
ncbi:MULTISPECIES: energy-coupling factor transporter transmembrane component T [Streptococcus]|uniref:Cobalt transporter n=1 Tax=Streptococcus periodonticum TaxID=2490633 RepID=A0A3S9MT60_9STRE|nr:MULTISPECIES: energy-coupling factor transporter transmembrane component T [Streptococcus]AZQ42345.1 cobalt transporter [Streptococcus periodonticum]MBF7050899.1 cobalt transporter [Streptococcus sp. HF-2466]RGN67460.1 cobalt transporter [Streptococcus anginosus]